MKLKIIGSNNGSDRKEMDKDRDDVLRSGKKAMALILAGLLSTGLLAGCAGGTTGDSSKYKNSTVMGEVTKVSKDSITIKVSSTKDNGSKESDKEDSSNASEKDEENAEIAETSEESVTIKLDDDTKVTKGRMGGPGGKGAPRGEPPQGEKPDGEPPEMPGNGSDNSNSNNDSGSNNSSNNSSDSNRGGAPGGNGGPGGSEAEVTDIEKGDNVEIKVDESGTADSIRISDGNGMPGSGGTDQNITYTAVNTYDSDKEVSGETIKSTGDDENAVLVKDGEVTVSDTDITRKNSSSNGEQASFYGTSSAVIGTGGKTYVKSSTVTTNAEGGAGIFSYGKGTVYASDTKISTSKGSSGGIHVAGGGTLYAWDMDVSTKGGSSAAIRSDRGGGKLVAEGGTYTTSGTGSPAIYSTADIAVKDARLTAKNSEAVCIEGKNSIRLYDSTLTGSMKDDDQNDCTWNVILYQSMSGDSEEGTSEFEMTGGTLKANNGGMFYTTNTSSKFVLNDVNIKYAEDNDFFLKATGNSNKRGWGKTGSNGADCDFTAISQKMKGDVIWDKISKLDLYITDSSSLTGAVRQDNSDAGSGKGGYCKVYIDKDSTWTVTGNSKVTELYNAGTIKDASGNKVTIKDTDGKVLVKGNSKFTITVE